MSVDTYAPVFIIEIDGKELSEDISSHVERFSYDDDEEKMDELKLTITDTDFSFVDNAQLQEDLRPWAYGRKVGRQGDKSPLGLSRQSVRAADMHNQRN